MPRLSRTNVTEFLVLAFFLASVVVAFLLWISPTFGDEPKSAITYDEYTVAYRNASIDRKSIVVVLTGNNCPACIRLEAWMVECESDGLLDDCYVCKLNRDATPQKCEGDQIDERGLFRRFSDITKSKAVPQVMVFDMATDPVRTSFLSTVGSLEKLRELFTITKRERD